jgi:hypothetical protein
MYKYTQLKAEITRIILRSLRMNFGVENTKYCWQIWLYHLTHVYSRAGQLSLLKWCACELTWSDFYYYNFFLLVWRGLSGVMRSNLKFVDAENQVLVSHWRLDHWSYGDRLLEGEDKVWLFCEVNSRWVVGIILGFDLGFWLKILGWNSRAKFLGFESWNWEIGIWD